MKETVHHLAFLYGEAAALNSRRRSKCWPGSHAKLFLGGVRQGTATENRLMLITYGDQMVNWRIPLATLTNFLSKRVARTISAITSCLLPQFVGRRISVDYYSIVQLWGRDDIESLGRNLT
jgi:hypothetical protein